MNWMMRLTLAGAMIVRAIERNTVQKRGTQT